MRSKLRGVLSMALALCLVCSLIPGAVMPVRASTGLTLAQLQQKFPNGKYWNGGNSDSYTSTPCTHHGKCSYSGSCGCNSFMGFSIQCMGFAEKLGYDATGYNPRLNANGWKTYTSSSALDQLKPGDIVRYKNNGHSIYVTAVNGDTVTYADGNTDGHCIIRWNATISKSKLKSTFTHLRSAPAAVTEGTVSCGCTTEGAGTYVCTTTSSDLMIRDGHGSTYSKIGTIPTGASVNVTKASGAGSDDWAHVEYNGVSGYASMKYLAKAATKPQVNLSHWLSYEKMGTQITSANQGHWAYLCYRLYDKSSGKNVNDLGKFKYSVTETVFGPDGSTVNTYTYTGIDNSWIGVACYTAGTYTYQIDVKGDWTATYKGTFTVAENPKKIYVSDDTVELILGEKETATIYAWTGGYYSGSAVMHKASDNSNVTTAWGDWTEDGLLPLTITARAEGTAVLTLSVRDAETSEQLHQTTVTVTVLAKQYTLHYDANGGTQAPEDQAMFHGSSVKVAPGIPCRIGYTFLGWGTSATATEVAYQPGATLSSNADTVLYAIWQPAATISSGVTNGMYGTWISFANGDTYYAFIPGVTGTYLFESAGTSDPQVSVFNANGELLTTDDDSGVENNFSVKYSFTAGQTYYVQVRLYGNTTGEITFFVKRVYAVSYDANGGEGAPETQDKIHGTALSLSEMKPVRSGYTFLGWSANSGGVAASYRPGGSYVGNANITLYAVWEVGCEGDEHRYAYQLTDAPTLSASGALTGVCSQCNAVTTVELPVLNKTDYTYTLTEQPTCLDAGKARYTWKVTKYGNFFVEAPVPAISHVYTGIVTQPTCTEKGFTENICLLCGDSYNNRFVDELGHEYVDGQCLRCEERDPADRWLIVSQGSAQPGQKVTVTVSLQNNPGISRMNLTVGYDWDYLALTKVTNGTVFSLEEWTETEPSPEGYVLCYQALETVCHADGVLAVLEFTVSDHAPVGTDLEISLSYGSGDVVDETMTDLALRVANGWVTVEAKPGTVTGTVTTGSNDRTTVELLDGDRVIATTTVSGKEGAYRIENVEAGTYTLRISKQNHVTRSYSVTVGTEELTQDVKIHLIGDVDGNGKINVGDVAKISSHIKGTNKLTDEYQILCANVNGGSLNMGDTAALYGHIKGSKKLY